MYCLLHAWLQLCRCQGCLLVTEHPIHAAAFTGCSGQPVRHWSLPQTWAAGAAGGRFTLPAAFLLPCLPYPSRPPDALRGCREAAASSGPPQESWEDEDAYAERIWHAMRGKAAAQPSVTPATAAAWGPSAPSQGEPLRLCTPGCSCDVIQPGQIHRQRAVRSWLRSNLCS